MEREEITHGGRERISMYVGIHLGAAALGGNLHEGFRDRRCKEIHRNTENRSRRLVVWRSAEACRCNRAGGSCRASEN
jgi:hypothetical protein